MEKELNIAAILKEKPKGTKLWSPVFGECKLLYITDFAEPIQLTTKSNETYCFRKDGRYVREGEIMLFPSKQMQDWNKFAWKKGDVLLCGVDNCCIFKEWDNDEYTEFKAEFATPNYSGAVLKTKDWVKVTREDTIKQYIAEIEEIKGGKLNLETLEIEHPKQAFKDGDILYVEKNKLFPSCIFIYQEDEGDDDDNAMYCYVHLSYDHHKISICSAVTIDNRNVRWATKEEKEELFWHLEKIGKRWNPETKTIEDLPKKCEFKPMDWCLMRDIDEVEYHKAITSEWALCQFSHYIDDYKFVAVGGQWHSQCIPYNEETKHLLGTIEEWKGGEA